MRTLAEFNDELQGWYATPYRHGISIKGSHGGVDCVRFVVSMLEWLHGRKADAGCIPFDFPASAAYVAKFPAVDVFNWMTDRYPCHVVYRKGRDSEMPELAPADVVVLEHTDEEPCHMMIAGDGVIWHSNNWLHGGRVSWTGLTEKMRESVWCIWRVDAARSLR
jgi:hypothetical protein